MVESLLYLCQTSREQNAFEDLSHFSKKLVDVRSFEHIDLMDHTIDFDRYDKISIVYLLKQQKTEIKRTM